MSEEMPRHSVELTLSVTVAPAPPVGELRRAAGQTWRFTGWLEFSAAVEAARSDDALDDGNGRTDASC